MRRLPRLFSLRAIIVLTFLTLTGCPSRAQSALQIPPEWNKALDTLAEKIAATAKPANTLSLYVKNISSLSATDLTSLHEELVANLAALKFRITEQPPADAQLQISFSESAEDYVWVAEILNGESRQTVMVSIPKPASFPTTHRAEPLLQSRIVWDQRKPILDFVELSGDANTSLLMFLGADQLEVYASGQGRVPRQATPMSFKSPRSRDLRGEIISVDSTHVRAYVEGINCLGEWNVEINITCDENAALVSDEWSYVARRNYFASVATLWAGPLAMKPNFYSVVYSPFGSGFHGATSFIQTELDGKARFYERSAPPDRMRPLAGDLTINHSLHSSVAVNGWGDDIAQTTDPCGSGWLVLVTGIGDWTQPDEIQVYELKGHQAVARGVPLRFPGPILALRASEDGKTARVVSRNLQTGAYEASIVSVSCGD